MLLSKQANIVWQSVWLLALLLVFLSFSFFFFWDKKKEKRKRHRNVLLKVLRTLKIYGQISAHISWSHKFILLLLLLLPMLTLLLLLLLLLHLESVRIVDGCQHVSVYLIFVVVTHIHMYVCMYLISMRLRLKFMQHQINLWFSKKKIRFSLEKIKTFSFTNQEC